METTRVELVSVSFEIALKNGQTTTGVPSANSILRVLGTEKSVQRPRAVSIPE